MFDPEMAHRRGLSLEQRFEEYINEWPTLYWGLEDWNPNATTGWFWFERDRNTMGAWIRHLEYWGA